MRNFTRFVMSSAQADGYLGCLPFYPTFKILPKPHVDMVDSIVAQKETHEWFPRGSSCLLLKPKDQRRNSLRLPENLRDNQTKNLR